MPLIEHHTPSPLHPYRIVSWDVLATDTAPRIRNAVVLHRNSDGGGYLVSGRPLLFPSLFDSLFLAANPEDDVAAITEARVQIAAKLREHAATTLALAAAFGTCNTTKES